MLLNLPKMFKTLTHQWWIPLQFKFFKLWKFPFWKSFGQQRRRKKGSNRRCEAIWKIEILLRVLGWDGSALESCQSFQFDEQFSAWMIWFLIFAKDFCMTDRNVSHCCFGRFVVEWKTSRVLSERSGILFGSVSFLIRFSFIHVLHTVPLNLKV